MLLAQVDAPRQIDCNRLRLDSFGKIYGCISATGGIDIRKRTHESLTDSLNEALSQKQDRFTGSQISIITVPEG